jgi:hypothetical protein
MNRRNAFLGKTWCKCKDFKQYWFVVVDIIEALTESFKQRIEAAKHKKNLLKEDDPK